MNEQMFILMRFYDNGGLANYEIVTCNEDDLYDYCVHFEEKCVSQNLGTHIGILELNEFNSILKEMNEII